MTPTQPEAVEAALKYTDSFSAETSQGMLKYLEKDECQGDACIRILAARVREMQREGSVERVGRLERALEAVIKSEPCIHEGSCFYPMHDGDGEPIGEHPVDPLSVIQDMARIAGEALFDRPQQPQPDQSNPDTIRMNWLERNSTQLPAMQGAPRTLSCSILCAGAITVREAIDAQMEDQQPQPEQAKEVDEVLYGLEGQEILDADWEDIVIHLLHTNCEKPGEPFDAKADRIEWPVKVLKFCRMKVIESHKKSLATSALEGVLESLDEEHADMGGDYTKPTSPMQLAARRFIDEVVRHYVVWSCEPTGEVIEITREQAKESFG